MSHLPRGDSRLLHYILPMPPITLLNRIAKRTAHTIDRALARYWPASAHANAPEALLTQHLAHHLMNDGFLTIPEVRYPDHSTTERLDLLAISPAADWYIAIETKLLNHAGQLDLLLSDIRRLRRFALVPDHLYALPSDLHDTPPAPTHAVGLAAGLLWVGKHERPFSLRALWEANPDAPPISDATRAELDALSPSFLPLLTAFHAQTGRYELALIAFDIPSPVASTSP